METETYERSLLDGKFVFKKLPDGRQDRGTVYCKLCRKEFAYHRSASTLRYHLNAKHVKASTETYRGSSSSQSQLQLDQMAGFRTKMSKSTSETLTNSLARWIALDCRPLSVVEDKGLEVVLQVATCDPTFKMPCRKTMSNKILQLYDAEKKSKLDALEKATFVALTGDHWTSVSNSNYLGVTAHFVDVTDGTWHLQSFALTVQKTNARHYAENCAEQFLSVAEEWGIRERKRITTIGTDSARTMIAAARHLQYHSNTCRVLLTSCNQRQSCR